MTNEVREMMILTITENGDKFVDLYNYNETTGQYEVEKNLNPQEPENGTLAGEVLCTDGSTIHTLRYNKLLHKYEETGEMCPELPEILFDYKVPNNVVLDADGAIVYTGTNFTNALQWACAKAGMRVYIPRGSYSGVLPVKVANAVHVFGDGSGTEGTIINFTYLSASSKGRGFYTDNVNDTIISDMAIRGHGTVEWWASNGKVQSGHIVRNIDWGVDSKAPWAFGTWVSNKSVIQDVSVEDCVAMNCGCIGFGLFGDKANIAEPSATGCRAMGGWVKNMTFKNCVAHGCGLASPRYNDYVVGFDLAEGVNIENIVIDNCEADNNWMNGYHLEQWPYTKQVKFINCQANYNGVTRSGGGYGFQCRNEVGVHETIFEGVQVAEGNKTGKCTCATI